MDFLAKRKINAAPKTRPNVSQNSIESVGLEIEELGKLNVPAFRYKTQVTIHGIWDDTVGYCNGYKSLVKNKNGSFGIRYCAIDAAKKRELVGLCQYSRFFGYRNSQDTVFVMNCKKHLYLAQKAAKSIQENDCFFGNVQLLKDTVYTGNYYIVVFLSSIFRDKVSVFSQTVLKVSDIKVSRIDKDREARTIELETKKDNEAKRKAAAIESATKQLESHGFHSFQLNGQKSVFALQPTWAWSKSDMENRDVIPAFSFIKSEKSSFGRWKTVSGTVRDISKAVELYKTNYEPKIKPRFDASPYWTQKPLYAI